MTRVSAARPLDRERPLASWTNWLAYASAGAACASIGLVSIKVWKTPHFAYAGEVAGLTAAASIASLTLNWALRRRARWWPQRLGAQGVTSWIVALQGGIVLLVVPVFLLVKSVPEEEMTGWLWPLVNKRWLVALYNIATVTFLLLPLAVERWRPDAEVHEQAADRAAERSVRRHWLRIVGVQIALALFCWYLVGPPWHIERLHSLIEWHEQLHFGPVQAIAKGSLPFIGPAATPYGPGSEMLLYGLMKLAGPLDVVSSRIAWAAQNFGALLIVSTVACMWLKPLPAAAVLVLAVLYSPFGFFYTLVDGTLAGFFGWANPLRYVAPLLVVPLVGWASVTSPSRWLIVFVGAVWGVGAFVAQENLTTTFASAGLLLAALWLTRTVTLRRAMTVLCDLLIGLACVAIPVVLYYAWHGAASAFLRTYFFFARAVVVGYSNMWWPAQDSALPEKASYYFTLPFLIGCGICALWRMAPLQPAVLDARRIRFLAFVCVQVVCYQTALLRSDSTHVMNTLVALPFIIVLGLIDLPTWLTSKPFPRWAIRAVFAALVMVVYPTIRPSTLWSVAREPARRFERRDVPSVGADLLKSAALRRLPLPPEMPLFLGNPTVSLRQFDNLTAEIHALVEDRKTYFLRSEWISGGLIALAADLNPAPHPLGGEILTVNDRIKLEIARHIRAHPQDYGAFIGPSLADLEAVAFLESHPGAITFRRMLGSSTFYVLLAPS